MEQIAREKDITPQQYADRLLKKVEGLQKPVWFKQNDMQIVCPYCEKDFVVLIDEQIITLEAFRAKVKREVEEEKANARKRKA